MSGFAGDLTGTFDFLAAQAAEAQAQAEDLSRTSGFTITGTSSGQIAVFSGTAYTAGVLVGDANGVSVAVVTAPVFGLQVSLAQNLKTTASPAFAGLTLGGGTTVKKVAAGSFAADPASIAATSTGTVDITITGLAVGDAVMLMRPDGLNDDLVVSGWRVQAVNTLRIYLYNPTAGAIDDGSLTWEYCWIDLT